MFARSSSAQPGAAVAAPASRRESCNLKCASILAFLLLAVAIQQISCAGGAGSSTTAAPAPTPLTTVTISPASAQLSAGGTLVFAVIVQNAANPAVIWQVNGIPGGNANIGTITVAGAATASYTAPNNLSAPLAITVTAVLQADASKFASATITVTPPPGAQITISPANANLVAGASLQFTATVENGPSAVIWEVNHIQGGTPSTGTISASGFYIAPATIPNSPVVTVTALLFSDSSISASTSLTIVSPLPTISISPSTANLIPGQTLQFSAAVQNSASNVVWQVNGTLGGNSIVGTISASGFYTAPTPTNTPIAVTISAFLQSDPSVSDSVSITIISANLLAGVYSWKNDNSLTGQNSQEVELTPSSVSGATGKAFSKLFGCAVDGSIFAQPLYVANVTVAGALHNVVYVATENDTVYAFDAESSSCQILWQVSLLDPGATAVPANDPNLQAETDIVPEIGISGTPVIDPATATLYVAAKEKTIVSGSPVYIQKLHALDLATGWAGFVPGAEKYNGPASIQAPSSAGFTSLTENQRAALILSGGKVYVAFDSYNDTDPFHGFLFAYDAADLQASPQIFNATPGASHGGIGQSAAAPSSDSNGNIFVVTSDGTFDVNQGGNDYGETLLKLDRNTVAPVLDYFTPWNQSLLNRTQKYFGSTGVVLLPPSAGGALPLAIAGSEAGSLYLVDRDKLGGFNGPSGPDNVLQTLCVTVSGVPASMQGTPAYWEANNTVYVAAANDHLKTFPLVNGVFTSPVCSAGAAVPASASTDTFDAFSGSYGASPVVSWDGNDPATGIVWALDTSGYPISSPAILHAYDANTLALLYKSSSVAGDPLAAGPAVKFAVPTVANGKVYLGTANELSVFGLQ